MYTAFLVYILIGGILTARYAHKLPFNRIIFLVILWPVPIVLALVLAAVEMRNQ